MEMPETTVLENVLRIRLLRGGVPDLPTDIGMGVRCDRMDPVQT